MERSALEEPAADVHGVEKHLAGAAKVPTCRTEADEGETELVRASSQKSVDVVASRAVDGGAVAASGSTCPMTQVCVLPAEEEHAVENFPAKVAVSVAWCRHSRFAAELQQAACTTNASDLHTFVLGEGTDKAKCPTLTQHNNTGIGHKGKVWQSTVILYYTKLMCCMIVAALVRIWTNYKHGYHFPCSKLPM